MALFVGRAHSHMHMMTHARACLLAILLAGTSVAAGAHEHAANDDRSEMSEGVDLLEQGARLLLRGLMQELAPALREMESGLRELEALMGDFSLYHAPEILPNGDILIRRRTPVAPPPDQGEAAPAPGEEIEL